jgi:hypothetical protein
MPEQTPPDPGVFVTKGMQIGISQFTLRFDPDGKITADPVFLSTGLDMCPIWLEIAVDHLHQTDLASTDMLSRLLTK